MMIHTYSYIERTVEREREREGGGGGGGRTTMIELTMSAR